MSENRRIARAAGLVSGFTLVSRFAGLVRDAVVGYYFGTGAAADAFFVAFRLPNLLRRFVAEGAMSVAFIPVFSDYLANRTPAETVRAARAVTSFMAVGLAGITILGIVFAPELTRVFAPGFVADASKFDLTVTLTRWVFPYLFFIALAALFGGILNAYRHFAAPAMSPVLLNLSIIASAILLSPHLALPVGSLAIGVVVGGVLQLLIHLPPLATRGIRLRPLWEPRHPAIRRSLWLMAPTVFGAAVYQVNVMVGTILASVLPSGSVSYLWYADRVFEFPLGLFATALGTAALPSFSTQAARGAHDEMRDSIGFAIRLTTFVAIPATVGLLCLATPITAVLFQRGAYTFNEVELTAWALSTFSVGLWSVSVVRVLVPAFYALNDTRTPVVTAAAAFVANCVCSLMFMGPVPVQGDSAIADTLARLTTVMAVADLRHAGLALATSVAATVNLVLLYVMLRRRLGGPSLGPFALSFGRTALASLAMVWPVLWVAGRIDWATPGHLWVKLPMLLAAVAAGIVTYAAAAWLLGDEDVRRLTQTFRRRLGVA